MVAPKLTPQQIAARERADQRAARAARIATAAAVNTLAVHLQGAFPAAFCDPPRPLAIGINKPLAEAVKDVHSAKVVAAFLGHWCRRTAYLEALARGEPRVDLDGNQTGDVTDHQREVARAAFAARQPADAAASPATTEGA
jgi:sRNA-binding protein